MDNLRFRCTIKKHARIRFIGIPDPDPDPEYADVFEAEVEGRVRTVHYFRDAEARNSCL